MTYVIFDGYLHEYNFMYFVCIDFFCKFIKIFILYASAKNSKTNYGEGYLFDR